MPRTSMLQSAKNPVKKVKALELAYLAMSHWIRSRAGEMEEGYFKATAAIAVHGDIKGPTVAKILPT